MTSSAEKKFWWALLACGAGILVMVLVAALFEGWHRDYFELGLFAGAFIAVVVSSVELFHCYKLEPSNTTGFWHLSLADLYAVALLGAVSMGLLRALWPDSFFPAGAITSVLIAGAFTLCLLLAAREGFEAGALKVAYASGLCLKYLGWMTFASVSVLSVVAAFSGGMDGFTKVCFKLFFLEPTPRDFAFTYALRLGLLCLPFGILITRGMEKLVSRPK